MVVSAERFRPMPNRTGFDLHPDQCRVVDVHVPAARLGRPRTSGLGHRNPRAEGIGFPGLSAELIGSARRQRLAREAWVTIWGLRSSTSSCAFRRPPMRPRSARAPGSARRSASLEAEAGRLSVALMIGADVQVGSHRRREVSLTPCSEAEVTRHIQPLIDAGFDVRGVCTPAMALAAVARHLRHARPGIDRGLRRTRAATRCAWPSCATVCFSSRARSRGDSPRRDEAWTSGSPPSCAARCCFSVSRPARRGSRGAVRRGMPNLRALTSSIGVRA